MDKIPEKVISRFRLELPRFQKVLAESRDRDINEADTVAIVSDMLEKVFGMDRYTDITREYRIKGTYADLAVKINDHISYLVEVKAIGTSLRDDHTRQAVNYAAKEGVKWVVLTNGIEWRIYRVQMSGKLDIDVTAQFNFLDLSMRKRAEMELLYLLCKRSVNKNLIESFYNRKKAINRYVIGALLATEETAKTIRGLARRITPNVKVSVEEIQNAIVETIKREVWESERGQEERTRVNRTLRAVLKKKEKKDIASRSEDLKELPESQSEAVIAKSLLSTQ